MKLSKRALSVLRKAASQGELAIERLYGGRRGYKDYPVYSYPGFRTIDMLEKQLSGVDSSAIAPNILERECLVL